MRVPFLKGGKEELATDPVCHMKVDKKTPPGGSWQYQGQSYYFCGPGCNRAFQKDPEGYLSGQKKMEM
jgi:YHS domain-containing protein